MNALCTAPSRPVRNPTTKGRVLWICGRVLQTSASPAGRVDKPVDNAGALPTAPCPHSRASRPQAPQDQPPVILRGQHRTTLRRGCLHRPFQDNILRPTQTDPNIAHGLAYTPQPFRLISVWDYTGCLLRRLHPPPELLHDRIRSSVRHAGWAVPDDLARLRQLGPLTDDNLLIFRDRTPKGRHYTARPRDPPTGLQDSSFGAGCFGNAKSS